MAEVTNNLTTHNIDEPKSSPFPWSTALLGAGLAASLGVGAWQHSSLTETKQNLSGVQAEVASLRQTVASTDGSFSEKMAALRQEMDASRRETTETVAATRKVALTAASKQAQLVAVKLNKQQQEQGQQIEAKLNEIKSSTDEASAKLTDITSQVGTVKTDVATTRTDLDKVVSDLHRTTGDMGVMSGLIATNSKELAALREIGERDYVEFNLSKTKDPQRVGDVLLKLKKADARRNRFSLELVADDKTVEKKDRNLNEPVQFYVTSKARQPYELVVNEVNKDRIVGYMAIPKLRLTARN